MRNPSAYQRTQLANGLRIVTHQMPDRDSVAVGIMAGTGGRYEDDRIKGVAHFLEHLAFKGSRKYSCEEIKGKIEGVGGSLNAFTSEEQTCYYAKIPARHLAQTFDILADMAFFPLLKPKDIEREKTVIVEEIKMYHDLPQYYVLDLLDAMVWPDHPLGRAITGTAESVTRMSREDINNFHREQYAPNNIVIAVAGQVRHQDIVALARRKLKAALAGQPPDFLKAGHAQMGAQVRFGHRPIEQMHLALGMYGLYDEHPDKYALNLIHIILGGNMSSRLFNEVREKRGLAYSISTGVKSLQDTGLFMVRAGVDNNKLVEALAVVRKELDKIGRRAVGRDEFLRAKDFYKGQVVLALEDTLDHMLWIGEPVITHDRFRTLAEVIRSINKVSAEDIRRVAAGVIAQNKYNLAVVGPVTGQQEKEVRDLFGVPAPAQASQPEAAAEGAAGPAAGQKAAEGIFGIDK